MLTPRLDRPTPLQRAPPPPPKKTMTPSLVPCSTNELTQSQTSDHTKDTKQADNREPLTETVVVMQSSVPNLPCLVVPCKCYRCQHIVLQYFRGTGCPDCATILCIPLSFSAYTLCTSCAHWEAYGLPLHNLVSDSAHPHYISDPLPQSFVGSS